MANYWIADLEANGDLRAIAPYVYQHLEQLPQCAELIGICAGAIWKDPESFEINLPTDPRGLELRWHATATTSGLMSLRWKTELCSITVLAGGQNDEQERSTIAVLQQKLIHELHGTPHEAAFSLIDLHQRPLAATINIRVSPPSTVAPIIALADRCFAAAYFRYLQLV